MCTDVWDYQLVSNYAVEQLRRVDITVEKKLEKK